MDRLQKRLATMSPEDRSAQARHSANFWESIDAPDGAPLVIVNPDFLDPALPPDAIQVIVADFNYVRGIERGRPLGPNEGAMASNLGVSRMKLESRWSSLRALMPEPHR